MDFSYYFPNYSGRIFRVAGEKSDQRRNHGGVGEDADLGAARVVISEMGHRRRRSILASGVGGGLLCGCWVGRPCLPNLKSNTQSHGRPGGVFPGVGNCGCRGSGWRACTVSAKCAFVGFEPFRGDHRRQRFTIGHCQRVATVV